ncbi:hypothetical protein C8J57DRAFT_1239555 [Mycena rebaudengoi]|nr:hypothetical protein C8J57DRAFT_1239555 [Mycena rebaudengoi]
MFKKLYQEVTIPLDREEKSVLARRYRAKSSSGKENENVLTSSQISPCISNDLLPTKYYGVRTEKESIWKTLGERRREKGGPPTVEWRPRITRTHAVKAQLYHSHRPHPPPPHTHRPASDSHHPAPPRTVPRAAASATRPRALERAAGLPPLRPPRPRRVRIDQRVQRHPALQGVPRARMRRGGGTDGPRACVRRDGSGSIEQEGSYVGGTEEKSSTKRNNQHGGVGGANGSESSSSSLLKGRLTGGRSLGDT